MEVAHAAVGNPETTKMRHKDFRSRQRETSLWPLLFTLYTLTF